MGKYRISESYLAREHLFTDLTEWIVRSEQNGYDRAYQSTSLRKGKSIDENKEVFEINKKNKKAKLVYSAAVDSITKRQIFDKVGTKGPRMGPVG